MDDKTSESQPSHAESAGNQTREPKMNDKQAETQSKLRESHLADLRVLYKEWDEIKARDGLSPIDIDTTNSYYGQYVKPTTDLDKVWNKIVELRKSIGLESQGKGKEKWCKWCKENEGKEFEHWA